MLITVNSCLRCFLFLIVVWALTADPGHEEGSKLIIIRLSGCNGTGAPGPIITTQWDQFCGHSRYSHHATRWSYVSAWVTIASDALLCVCALFICGNITRKAEKIQISADNSTMQCLDFAPLWQVMHWLWLSRTTGMTPPSHYRRLGCSYQARVHNFEVFLAFFVYKLMFDNFTW